MAKKYKLALLGSPIAHSLSPNIHKIFAEGCGLDVEYIKIQTDKDQLKDTVNHLKSEDFSGFNCTMPLKEEIIKYTDQKSAQCLLLNSCNTVKIDDGSLYAYTTDGYGMLAGIRYNGFEITKKNILLIGAGGSAKSIILSLAENEAKSICVLNRTKQNLDIAKNLFAGYKNIYFDLFNSENIKKYIKESDTDILINASRLGMAEFEEGPDFDPEYGFLSLLKAEAAVADCVYNPLDTKLLSAAKKLGHGTIDGFWMLVYQGVLAFEIWTGAKVPEEYIKKAHGIIKRQKV